MNSSDEEFTIHSLDNPTFGTLDYAEQEAEIAYLCEKYKYKYTRYNRIITINTRFSEWYFNICGPRYKLHHKNSYLKGSGKWSEDYHNQKQQKKFKRIKSIFIYISTHDRNKYCKESKDIERINQLLHTVRHKK